MDDHLKLPAGPQVPQPSEEPGTDEKRMLAGELYYSFKDPVLLEKRLKARQLMHEFNNRLSPDDETGRKAVVRQLFNIPDTTPDSDLPHVEAPFLCDYGTNISFGKDVFINFNCTILDCNCVRIGSRVLFASNVSLYPATHPLDPAVRNGTNGPEYAQEITIGDDVWIGGNAVILPGVTVGNGATVGAGSVVTKDVEPYTVVAGNPAKLVRRLPKPAATA